MKHIIIKNFGPIKEADIELKRINVIIGPQSSGKSCVLKTACYCTWVEKRIELMQTSEFFATDDNFLKEFIRFHKLKGYIRTNSYIKYDSDFMSFTYDNLTKTFDFKWKENRWKYKRSKVTYVPAERNLVATIPNWYEVKFEDDNIRSFMADWESARKATQEDINILNLGVSYHYDANTKSDKVQVADGVTLDFTNTSSGLQSVIPLFIHLYNLVYKQNTKDSIINSSENQTLYSTIYEELFRKTGKADDIVPKIDSLRGRTLTTSQIGRDIYLFKNATYANECNDIYKNFVTPTHCDIFLEEPEANLFPPTQSNLVEWLLDLTKDNIPNNLFIATHSPYILTSFIEKKDLDIQLFYTKLNDSIITVSTATQQDIQDIYDFGVDAFYNIENLD